MKNYKVIIVGKRQHVVCNTFERLGIHKNANYMATGMALCGILNEGESLESWIKRTGK